MSKDDPEFPVEELPPRVISDSEWKNAEDAVVLEKRVAELESALRFSEGCVDEASKRIAELEGELSKALWTIEELRHAWKDLGGDDGQGHYEGDYTVQGQVDRIRAKLGTGGGE